ncbi:MAG: MFS transporter [Acidobacteria bacterium]|nr:MFS transporter [Acidobacteriota bacterium]
MTSAVLAPPAAAATGPWYRQVNRTQWNAFLASFLSWTLDGFDFTIVSFLLADLQTSFSVSKAAVGAIGTVTLFARVIGGIGAGTAADRWGRKGPLMFSVLWYSGFAFLSGLSTTFGMLLALRALFGIGMGGVWAAGMPLTLEHWPARLRGIASGMLQGGYSTGFIISALVFQYAYPLVNTRPDFGWRVMFFLGALPALLVFFIMSGVKESPVWLERQRHLRHTKTKDGVSLAQLFRPDLIKTTLLTSLMMTMFIFSYYSVTFWYATFIISKGLKPVSFSLLLNIGGVTGAIAAGRLAETALGRRGAATLMMAIGIVSVPLYVLTDNTWLMWLGAFLVGFFAAGAWGMVPTYLNERFPTAVRAVGAGFAYHVGAAVGSFTPAIIGAMQDRGMTLATSMASCIALAGVLVIATVWMGPETLGRQFQATD